MSINGVYPWQYEQWTALQQRLQMQKLPHALLLHGETGLGVDHFAERFLRTLLCCAKAPPCRDCRACKLYASGNHPDFLEIAAEKEGGEIRVSQIRTLVEYLQTTRHYGDFKLVWIRNADAMNRAAANALLKTLEEPPSASFIMLTSHFPFRMPATVRSRCQGVRLACFGQAQACKWLAETEAISENEARRRLVTHRWRPLLARPVAPETSALVGDKEDFYQDIMRLCRKQNTLDKVADKWQKQPPPLLHGWFLELAEAAIARALRNPPAQAPAHRLFSFYDRQKYRYYSLKLNFNPRLLLEVALVEWRVIHCEITS